jgi:hypothetical protein
MKISKTYSRVALMIGLVAGLGFGSAVTAQVKLPAPVIAQPTEPGTPIVYPSCPNGFTLTQKGAYVYACKAMANEALLNLFVLSASTMNCDVSDHWQDEPVVTTQGAGNNITVRTKCFAD